MDRKTLGLTSMEKKFFEVQDGVTESNHGIIDYLVVTSRKWWDGLPKQTRDQLAQILKEVTEARNSESYQINQANKKKVVDSGGTVRQLSDSQRKAWIKTLKPVWNKFEKNIGKDLIDAAISSNR